MGENWEEKRFKKFIDLNVGDIFRLPIGYNIFDINKKYSFSYFDYSRGFLVIRKNPFEIRAVEIQTNDCGKKSYRQFIFKIAENVIIEIPVNFIRNANIPQLYYVCNCKDILIGKPEERGVILHTSAI